jgi:hypothetical protein
MKGCPFQSEMKKLFHVLQLKRYMLNWSGFNLCFWKFSPCLHKGKSNKTLALLGRHIYIKTTLLAATTLESVITAGKFSCSRFDFFWSWGWKWSWIRFEVYSDVEGAGFCCLQCSEGNVAVGFSGPETILELYLHLVLVLIFLHLKLWMLWSRR